jgi:hypothetical protein
MVNGLDPSGLFFSTGLFYICHGHCTFGITTPVEPMKVIGAYAIATAMTPQQIMASGILMGACLLVIGATGAIALIGKYITQGRRPGGAAVHGHPAHGRRGQVHDGQEPGFRCCTRWRSRT